MGQTQNNTFKELIANYEVERREPELMKTYLTHKQTQEQCLFKEFTYNELRQFSLTAQKLSHRKVLKNSHYTQIQICEERVEDAMCSNFYKIYSLWEYPHRPLQQEIDQKVKSQRSFSEQQILQILKSAVQGLKMLQQNDIKHECLTTDSILLSKKGLWKVTDPLTLGYLNNIDEIYGIHANPNIYLSPEQCSSIESQRPIKNKNSFKNDVFTLGMILLQSGLLSNLRQCYSEGYAEINWKIVDNKKSEFASRYRNDELYQIIEMMLQNNMNNRPDWLQLGEILQNKEFLSVKSTVKKEYALMQSPRRSAELPTIKSVVESQTNQQNSINPSEVKTSYVQSQPQSQLQQNRQSYLRQQIEQQKGQQFQSVQQVQQVQQGQQSRMIPKRINPVATVNFVPPSQRLTQVSQPEVVSTMTIRQRTNELISPPKNKINFNITPSAYASVPHNHLPSPPSTSVLTNRANSPVPMNIAPKQQKNFNQVPYTSSVAKPPPIAINNINQVKTQQFYQVQSPKSPTLQQHMHQQKEVVQQHFPLTVKKEEAQKLEGQSDSSEPQLVEEYFKFGSRYEGYKVNGKRHGQGTFYYQDGGKYEGEWENDKMTGSGTLYYQSNVKAYQGEWLNDQFHGQGVLYNQNPEKLYAPFNYKNFDEVDDCWVTYEGNFKNDAKEGEGTLVFSNGEEFRGNFRCDMVQGEGRFFTLKSGVVYGLWHQNQLVRALE